MDVLANDLRLAMKKIEELKAENISLRSKIKSLEKSKEELWMANKLQMSKIVEYRRLIEHYEDGAPLYVQRDG